VQCVRHFDGLVWPNDDQLRVRGRVGRSKKGCRSGSWQKAVKALWGAVTPITPAVHHPHACAAPSEPRRRLTPSAAQRVGACVDTRAVLAVQTKKYTTHLKWTREHFRVWTCMETGLFSAMAPSHTSYGLAHAPAPTHSSMHAVQARAKPSAARPSCGQPRHPRAIRPRAPHPGRRRAWLK